MYLADEGGEGGGAGEGQPAGSPAPADGAFQMPEKFTGKSPEDIAKAYAELEKEYGKKSGQSVDYNKIGELIDNKLTNFRPSKEETLTPDEAETNKRNQEYAKSIGLATVDDVNKARDEGYKKAMLQLTATQLETKFDGKDGRPAFKAQEIAEWITSGQAPEYLKGAPLEAVYEARFSKEITDWKIAQALKGNRAPIVPKGGPKAPPGTPDTSKMTEDQRKAHLKSQIEAGAYDN